MHRFLSLAGVLALIAVIACSDDLLGTPSVANAIDTVTLGALEGTPISVASGYNISVGAVRTDDPNTGAGFEFAYNVRKLSDGTYQRVFLPRAVLVGSSTTADPGLQPQSKTFDEITRAVSNGYTADSAVPIQVGDRLLVRSRVVCVSLGLPLYGKLEILSFQDSTVTFKVLTDLNCGFRDLNVGIPKN
ncbi:MAG TPA: hypothetical protein VFN08_18150 [Gemmatimonadales bacterium]|jgi:hypothetical protein|nr:hypothetical protein [Gemmatimonadales bacterium]